MKLELKITEPDILAIVAQWIARKHNIYPLAASELTIGTLVRDRQEPIVIITLSKELDPR